MARRDLTPRVVHSIRAIGQFVKNTQTARRAASEAADQYNALAARRQGRHATEDPERVFQKAQARARARRANAR